jgi:hypothetical protein
VTGAQLAADGSTSGRPLEISPQEFAAALEYVRAGNVRISSVPDLLRAFELGVLTKTEVRARLGLGATQGIGAASRARVGGRFVRDDEERA